MNKSSDVELYIKDTVDEQKTVGPDSSTDNLKKPNSLEYAEDSLFVFSLSNPFRKIIIKIVSHDYFKNFMLFIILVNSVIFALPDYSHVYPSGELKVDGSWQNRLVDEADVIFVALFTAECVLKVIAWGFYSPQGAYITDPWNILDFLIVVLG